MDVFTCTKCHQSKPHELFYRRLERKQGYRRTCNDCTNAQRRQHRLKNKERLRQRGRNYYHRNVARFRVQKRAYYKKNPDDRRRYRRTITSDGMRLQNARRKARKLAAPRNDFTVEQWTTMKAVLDHRCSYCARQMERLTMDHLTPLVHGGSHTLWNILPACRSCNCRKNAFHVLKPVQPFLLLP